MKNLSFPGLPRVLVVDDEEGVREGLRALLQREGVHVETAGSAEDGERRIENRSFDIVTTTGSVSNGTGGTMNFSTDAAATGTLDATGETTFSVGGTLTVGANQAAGSYTGSYTATVTYN